MSRRGPGGEDALAPVTYLPGAREALARAEAQPADEADAAHDAAPAGEVEPADGAETVAQAARAVEAERDDAAEARRAENITMHALTRRGQSRAEIGDLLHRREVDAGAAEAELDRLERVGLLDDRALAADLVDRLRTRKKLGPSALRQELMRRKIDRDAIEDALSEAAEDDRDDLVTELARDRARRLGGLDRTTAERRLIDFLARKGHTGSTARDAARRALDERDSGFDGGAHRVEFR
jgi:regulatory protein